MEKQKANAKELTNEAVELFRENFVATYEREENACIMRLPNGQKFKISRAEIS